MNLLLGVPLVGDVVAEGGEGVVVEVGQVEAAVFLENVADGAQKEGLVGVEWMGLNVGLELAVDDVVVIGDGFEFQERAPEFDQAADLNGGCWRG